MTDNLPELPDQPIWVACDVTGVLPHRLLTTEEDANAHKRQRYEGNPAWAVWKYLPQAAIASERARADALEAALQELLQARDAWSGFSDGTIEYIRERDRWYSAINAARSLLEKTNDRKE